MCHSCLMRGYKLNILFIYTVIDQFLFTGQLSVGCGNPGLLTGSCKRPTSQQVSPPQSARLPVFISSPSGSMAALPAPGLRREPWLSSCSGPQHGNSVSGCDHGQDRFLRLQASAGLTQEGERLRFRALTHRPE